MFFYFYNYCKPFPLAQRKMYNLFSWNSCKFADEDSNTKNYPIQAESHYYLELLRNLALIMC